MVRAPLRAVMGLATDTFRPCRTQLMRDLADWQARAVFGNASIPDAGEVSRVHLAARR